MGLFDFLRFGKKREEKISDFRDRGAILIDVRSKAEFKTNHAKGSVCIPLEQISGQIKSLQHKNKPLLLCCATGGRSGVACGILEKQGLECYNAGGWRNLS